MEKNIIVINYKDSDFMNEIDESVKIYCEDGNQKLNYWSQVKDKQHYEKLKEMLISNVEYIQTKIVNKLIGSYILNTDFHKLISDNVFNDIKRICSDLTKNIEFLSEEEFKNKESELEFSEQVAIFFREGNLSYKIY